MKDLDDRMKDYEKCFSYTLPYNIPVIVRIDGRAFHTFTRGLEKPFDNKFVEMMEFVAVELCKVISGARFAYLQSDEINILLHNGYESDPWFDNKVVKITTISASLATAYCMLWKHQHDLKKDTIVSFDSRAFSVPEFDVVNYFIFRQRDWERNSLQMLARKYYSQKKLQGCDGHKMHDMIYEKGDNWDKLPTKLKRGRCVIKVKNSVYVDKPPYFTGLVERGEWVVDNEIPIFSTDRNYITSRMNGNEVEKGSDREEIQAK